MEILVVVTSEQDKDTIEADIDRQPLEYAVEVLSLAEIRAKLETGLRARPGTSSTGATCVFSILVRRQILLLLAVEAAWSGCLPPDVPMVKAAPTGQGDDPRVESGPSLDGSALG